MRRESLVKRWIHYFEEEQEKIAPAFLFLIGLAFLISDFIHYHFSFADFIFIAVLPILFIMGQYRIYAEQVKWLFTPVLVLLINIILSVQHIPGIETTVLVTQSIKGLFYLFALVGLYNYIRRNQEEERFLKVNNVLAIFSVCIGVYITIALYSDGRLPFEGLWHFTRSHPTSYEFQGNSDIIRTRSLFSEPAHFGFYLNSLLACNLFNKQKFEKQWLAILFLVVGVMITLSYSMIGIMFLILLVYLISMVRQGKVVFQKKKLAIIPLVLLVLLMFWDVIDETLIQRTLRIFSGDDSSAFNRMIESWEYVSPSHWWLGNGIGHTPTITNNFAYVLSDFGIIGFIPAVIFTIWLLVLNLPIALVYVMLNISRGGYLSPTFWLLTLFTLLYSAKQRENEHDVKELKYK